MRRYLTFAAGFFGSLALFPMLIGLVGAFDEWSGFVLIFFGLPTALLALAIGAVAFLVHGVRCANEEPSGLRKTIAVLASPVLALSVVLLAAPSAWAGWHLGDLIVKLSRYNEVVAP